MATKEEIYVSISQDSYRENKSNVLMSKADLLETMKRLHNLKVLARQKQDLKRKLHKILSSTLSDINSIQEKIPTPKIPKTIKKEIVEEIKTKQSLSKRDGIEDELKSIQEKLRELNS